MGLISEAMAESSALNFLLECKRMKRVKEVKVRDNLGKIEAQIFIDDKNFMEDTKENIMKLFKRHPSPEINFIFLEYALEKNR